MTIIWSRVQLVAICGMVALASGCDQVTILEVDGASSRTVYFACGQLLLEAGQMGPILTLVCNYDLADSAIADVSLIQVYHADTLLPFVAYRNGVLVANPVFPIRSKGCVSIQIKQRAAPRDTIAVHLYGSVRCQRGHLDTVVTRILLRKAKD